MIALTPKSRKGLVLASLAIMFVMACGIVAQVPPPSDAYSLGAPDKNIESNNCFCHTNTLTGKEKDSAVAIVPIGLPNEMGSGTMVQFNISLNYSKATKDTRWGFAVDLDSSGGKSLNGAALSSPVGTASENKTHLTHNEILDSNNLQVTLTAPSKAQTLKVIITANAVDNDGTEKGDHWNYIIKEITILKLREVYINTSVRNRGDMDSTAVNVTLLIDGEFMDQQTIQSVKAGGEQNITFTWDATKYKAGEYKVEVLLDSNQTVLELNEGNNKLVKTVTLDDISGSSSQPYDYTQVAYWVLGITIVMLVVGLVWKFYG